MDFLTNGFQQLFAELDDDIQQNFKTYSRDIPYNTFDYNNVYKLNNEAPEVNVFFENGSLNDFELKMASLSSPSTTPSRSSASIADTLLDTFEITTAYENNYLNEQNFLSFDFDWENQFLDNYIELPDFVNLLPEKTPLCSDSCNLFLKESSENLSKFRQTTDSFIINEEKNNNSENTNYNENFVHNKAVKELIPLESNNNFNNDISIKITFPCTWESCEKVYAKPAHLRAHLRRHLGDKPYICNWPNCTWRFSRSDELARHKRSHSGIKPFKCIYCPKCFARSDHLAKHRKVHERKMAASKIKGIYIPNLHQVRPGRKPKNGQYY